MFPVEDMIKGKYNLVTDVLLCCYIVGTYKTYSRGVNLSSHTSDIKLIHILKFITESDTTDALVT